MSRKKTQNKTNIILERISDYYHLENDADIASLAENQIASVNESHSPYPTPDTLLRKAAKVLRSNSSFRSALNSNIESFHEAIELREELDIAQVELKQCQIMLANQTVKIDGLQQRNEQQQQEIEVLKAQVKLLSDQLLTIKSA